VQYNSFIEVALIEYMEAVAYVRLSKDDGSNPSLSPENQKKIIESFAKQKGDKVIGIFEDINRTGSNLDRPGFQKMLEEAKEGIVKKIYIKDWSRLTRDIADLRNVRKQIEKDLNIEIKSCDGVSDDKAIDINTLSNDWFIKECKRKQEEIHALKLSEQIPCSRPPYGYRMSKKLKKFVVHDEEAEDVKKIYGLREDGLSISKIAKEMNMNISKVFGILNNRTYLGEMKYAGEWMKGRHEAILISL
jgi:site-specific DNA recombinase